MRYVPVRNLSGTYRGQTYSGVSPVCQYYGLPLATGAESKAVGLVSGGGFWIRPSAMPKGTVVFLQDSPGQSTVSPKGHQLTVLPPGGSFGHQSPPPSKPGAVS